MRELLYAGEPVWIRNWLEAKLNASEADKQRALERFAAMDAPGSADAVDKIYHREGDIAIITVAGPLSMAGPDAWDLFFGYGGTAYPTLIEAIHRAADDPSVAQVLFLGNTPGGEVNGADLTYQAHVDLVAKKKTRCLVSGMLASAGYYFMCPARIEASAPTDLVGSIGVIYASWDFSEAYASMGIRRVEIRSANAPKKAQDVSTKAGRDVIQERVDATERIFYQRIAEARGVTPEFIREHFGQGALFVARDPDSTKPDALRSKMIDALASEPGEFPIPSSPEPEPEDARAAADPKAAEFPVSPPAEAGKSSQEVPKMAATLHEFLAQNPAAASEIEKIKKDAADAARADQVKIGTRVGEIIASDAYAGNKVLRAKAAETLSGKMGIDAFEAVVAMADMQAEGRKSEEAAGESEGLGDTGGQAPKGEAAELGAFGKAIADASKPKEVK
jgi:ClpP class serine protease